MKAELTKGDVYVVVDTPKKAKKLKKLLNMFGEPISKYPNHESICHNGSDYGWAYGFSNGQWQGFNTKSLVHNGKEFRKVSIKELRIILAKEHLKEGDLFVGKNGMYKFIGVYKGFTKRGLIEVSNWHNLNKDRFFDNISNSGGFFNNFKRYATPEEIALLEPKELDKFSELKEAHKNGAVIQYKNWTTKYFLDCPDNLPKWDERTEYRIKPSSPVKVGDWMFNTNSKKITQVKKDNHGKSLIGSGWIKIKDTELVEKLNSL